MGLGHPTIGEEGPRMDGDRGQQGLGVTTRDAEFGCALCVGHCFRKRPVAEPDQCPHLPAQIGGLIGDQGQVPCGTARAAGVEQPSLGQPPGPVFRRSPVGNVGASAVTPEG